MRPSGGITTEKGTKGIGECREWLYVGVYRYTRPRGGIIIEKEERKGENRKNQEGETSMERERGRKYVKGERGKMKEEGRSG